MCVMYIYIYIHIHKVRAYDDRALGPFVRNSYVSTLCPVVICPYLCTSEARHVVAPRC